MKFRKKLCYIIMSTLTISLFASASEVKGNENFKKDYDMLVVFKESKVDKDVENIIKEQGGQIVKEIPEAGGLEVRCNMDLASEIRKDSDVYDVTLNEAIKVNNSLDDTSVSKDELQGDLFQKYQWDIRRITNNGASFNIESGNHNVVIGILDTGIDSDHPDLRGNLMGGKNIVPKNFAGNSLETGDVNNYEDSEGHGTMVAGQIAANGRIKGAAPNIGIKSYRILDSNGFTDAAVCADGVIAAVKDGVNVINMSLSSYVLEGKCYVVDEKTGEEEIVEPNKYAEYLLCKRAVEYAEQHNVIVVASAGNDGLDCKSPEQLLQDYYKSVKDPAFKIEGKMHIIPAYFANVVTVSATCKDDSISSYSNYGQGFIKIAAPGGKYVKDGEGYDNDEACLTTSKGGRYSFELGTSFSAPKVAAAAGLILCKNKDMTAEEVKEKLYNSADKKDNESFYGCGILNIYNALIS